MFLKKISDNLNFQNILTCSEADVRVILEIRNEERIRNNMFNNKIISLEEHLLWKKNLLETNTDRFYCIKYKKIIVGGLGLKNYNIKNIFCYILISNAAVINLHKKFGFKKINIDSNFEDNFLNVKKKDVLRMKLSKFEWIANKSSIYNKFLKK